MPKCGMTFEFTGFVIPGRELKSKTTDWKATLFKLNAMNDIFEVVVTDDVMIENLKKVGDKTAHITGVIEHQMEKLSLVPLHIEVVKA